MTARLLLVEDDLGLRLGLTASLRAHGYEVDAVASSEEAYELAQRTPPDLVVLDWNLPGESGLSLLERWRAAGSSFAVIMLTARDSVPDRVRGLEVGADDYLVKPFATEELIARIAVRLRSRTLESRAAASSMSLSGTEIDMIRGTVRRDGKVHQLTSQELAALAYLASRPGQVIAREDLLRDVWGYRSTVITRAVDNTILRLRAKVEPDPGSPRHILTVHGVGYRFER
ncbi:MAG: response regulator transcription factor [Kofleriaceae bacterium]